MKQSFFRTFFSFSRNQQRGIIALSFLLLCSCLFLWLYDPSFEETFDEEVKTQVSAFLSEQKKIKESEGKKWGYKKEIRRELALRTFDPNTENVEGFVSMGFSQKMAMNFINYREKVRLFKSKEDVLALYAVDQKLFDQIQGFIQINESYSKKKPNSNYTKKAENEYVRNEYKSNAFPNESEPLYININIADTSELKLIKGIGSYYAKSIVKFRDALGGFHSREQIREIYAFQKRPEAVEPLLENVYIDDSQIIKLNINSVSKEELIMHPYLKTNVAKALFNYRSQNGTFEILEDIKKCHLVTDEIYLKIAPYLSLQ